MLKKMLAAAAVTAALVAPAAQAQTGLSVFVGEIRLMPYEKCPREWIESEGQEMAISRHSALYRLIGTRFGGDGQISFNLPDLRDAVPERGLRYCMSLQGAYPALR